MSLSAHLIPDIPAKIQGYINERRTQMATLLKIHHAKLLKSFPGMDVTPTNEVERGFTIGVVVFALVTWQKLHFRPQESSQQSSQLLELDLLLEWSKLRQGGLRVCGWKHHCKLGAAPNYV